ncbi:MAG: TIGR03067 domain-containing protein [Planctomycetota bacterium]|nr:TIGR03067 domain-containing protein [Planctomycetota bacterium]
MRKAFLASSAAIIVLACTSVVYNAPDKTLGDHPDLANLKGEWQITSVEGDGTFRWQMIGAGVTVRINNVSLQLGGSLEAIRDYYVVSPLKTPKELDVTFWGEKQFITQHGIYQLSGYTLTLCMAPCPAARPTQFAAEPGKSTLIVLQRVIESIELSGRVVDDATGKPVSNFSIQGGRVDDKDPAKITWGYSLETRGSNPKGEFSAHLGWSAGWRSRIVAGGYVPQPILTELPKDGGTQITGLVIRLKRGRQVSGHVFDHAGKPVKDAGVYVVGNPSINLTGGKAMELTGDEDKKAIRVATDADGAFTVTGIGEDAQRIAITSSALDLWVVPVPKGDAANDNLEIRLPQPGKLVVHYDIAGAPDKARLFMQLHTWEMPGWRGVTNERYDPIQQHVEFVLDNLPPGDYTINRVRELGMKRKWGENLLDRRTVKIESGKTVVTDFVRSKGAPITGQVVGLDQGEVAKAKPTHVFVRVLPLKEERTQWLIFDVVTLEPDDKPMDGRFTTERISPGQYKVRVEVFVPETEQQRRSTGIVPPGFVGEALVTVPEEGLPEPVKIQLAPLKFPAR